MTGATQLALISNNSELSYIPERTAKTGIYASYQWLGIGFCKDSFFDTSEAKVKQYFVESNYEHFAFMFHSQTFKGIEEVGGKFPVSISDQVKNENRDSNLNSSRIRSDEIFAFYFLNPEEYDYRILNGQNSLKTKTGGSAGLMFNWNRIKLDSGEELGSGQSEFSNLSGLNGARLINYSVMAGGGYNYFVLGDKAFIGGQLFIGPGISDQRLHTIEVSDTHFVYQLFSRIGMGFIWKNFYMGLYYYDYQYLNTNSNTQFITKTNMAEAYLGLSF